MRTTANSFAPSQSACTDLNALSGVEFNAEAELVGFALETPERDLVA